MKGFPVFKKALMDPHRQVGRHVFSWSLAQRDFSCRTTMRHFRMWDIQSAEIPPRPSFGNIYFTSFINSQTEAIPPNSMFSPITEVKLDSYEASCFRIFMSTRGLRLQWWRWEVSRLPWDYGILAQFAKSHSYFILYVDIELEELS